MVAADTGEIQLKELISKEAARTAEIELKVWRVDLISYSYTAKTPKADTVHTQKLQVVLLSRIGEQYCVGLARLRKKEGESELKTLQTKFRKDTVWKFSRIKLTEEKSQYIHTPCRIVIDLRNSVAQPVLQSRPFPRAPVPTCTIANVLELKQMQRFDLMAIPVQVLDKRRTGAGQLVADVRLVDGSTRPAVDGAEVRNAALPLTIWFKGEGDFASFEARVGCKPVVFYCLAGSRDSKSGKVQVTTLKDLSWWEDGAGAAYDTMTEIAPEVCGGKAPLVDVASLPIFELNESADYISPPATYSACGVLGAFAELQANAKDVLGNATEHLYQLNHVHVQAPTKTDSITTSDGTRLFTQLTCIDFSRSAQLFFRSEAMLQLAQLTKGQEGDYRELVANDEVRHPLLVSLRVRVRPRNGGMTEPSQGNQTSDASGLPISHSDAAGLSIIVVEVEPYTFADIPNDSIDAIHGLLACQPKTSDRLATSRLNLLSPSPFYNMLANGEPADKALVLLHFQQTSKGNQLPSGFRIVSERVQDAANPTASEVFSTVALCTVEKSPFFTATKGATFLAIISKVLAPEKPGDTAVLCIEAMDPVPEANKTEAVTMLQRLETISQFNRDNAITSDTAAWEQRKCRKLSRYPTAEEHTGKVGGS